MKAASVSAPWNLAIRRVFSAKVKTEIVDTASGITLKSSDWIENLVFDNALSYLVSGQFTTFAGLFTTLKIGSGTNANSFAGGGITFTQSGNTITASGGFFTSGMVGGKFKYGASGSGGAEYYITGFTDTQHVTVDTSATVGTPTAATVWMVQQTALQTFLAKSTGYQTNSGDNQTVISGGSITLQRTFVFATPGSTQTINEIGYSDNNTADGTCRGRIVLPSTDTVDTAHFYRVVMQLNVTVAPSAPSAVSNVGTNIDTSGNVMFDYYDFDQITGTGEAAQYQSSGLQFMDGGNLALTFCLETATFTQPGGITLGAAAGSPETFTLNMNTFTTAGQPLGQEISTTNFIFTTAGQTLYGFGAALNGPRRVWSLKLTTTVTLPTGTFQGSLSITKTFTRTLTN